MGFLGVYTALYDYEPRAEGELLISEGDLLFVLEKGDGDGWWKAKKKAGAEEEDEPVGLIPNNYIEQAPRISYARAIYEYTRQTDEELSFPEDAALEVFDMSDPDWILVGLDDEYGFVPSNYIEMQETKDVPQSPSSPSPPTLPMRPQSASSPSQASVRSPPSAAAALATVMQGRAAVQPSSPSTPPKPPRQAVHFDESQGFDIDNTTGETSPALPTRPRPTADEAGSRYRADDSVQDNAAYRNPGGFHMYNINEMVSVMGKRKKMPTTLGINLGTGIILIAPERAEDDPPQEWSAEKMTHYSREGKHVFMELVKPSKSIDFHAGAKDTAEEIVAALGELAGASRAEGLREVIMAGSQRRLRKGHVAYDFMAQGNDEVTVAAGDDVVILDDSRSEEWWQVRRVKNGKEGVVPASYIEVTGTITPPQVSPAADSARATVEQNRLEEIRLTKEAIRASKEPQNHRSRENGREGGRTDSGAHSRNKSKPDSSKIRTWTDRSGSFSVDAQFLGLKDGKIHLHKMNGVKIAVPIAKMSRDDLEYVENKTGISLEDDKPLADIKRAKSRDKRPSRDVGASVGRSEKPEYDWFQFFLSCDVPVGLCERYAQAFIKDSMDESVLPDVNATILRTLGLREGDIIKVMRALDNKYGRERSSSVDGDAGAGGLFSGPGGALRNNTRKGRPAPAVQTSDVVDAAAFSKTESSPAPGTDKSKSPSPASPAKVTSSGQGFDDDAWTVKPQGDKESSQPMSTAKTPSKASETAPAPTATAMTGSMKELSLLTEPLEPSRTEPVAMAGRTSSAPPADQPEQKQLAGASPSFFSSLPPISQTSQPSAQSSINLASAPRQRPVAPTISPTQGSLMPPPPQRPLSAPLSALQNTQFAPPSLAPQMTGVQTQIAPPGQSLNDIAQARYQQQYASQLQNLQPAMTGYGQMQYQVPPPNQYMQPMMTGMVTGSSPFADPVGQAQPSQFSAIQHQQTGFAQNSFGPPMPNYPQGANNGVGINSYLSQALEPQRTGAAPIQPQQTGPMGNSFTTQPLQPLQPQKTGPPPPVRFGVSAEAKKLTPQQTGRRANLAQATPDNPFGF